MLNTRIATKFYSITIKDNTIISYIRKVAKSATVSESNQRSNLHFDRMRQEFPSLEQPHLARYLSGCTAKTTRYIIPLADLA